MNLFKNPKTHKTATYLPHIFQLIVPINITLFGTLKNDIINLTLVSLSLKISLFATQAIRELKL